MLVFLSMPAAKAPDPAFLEERIKAIARGDTRALGELYDGTHAAVYGFALSLLKNAHDAEDVLQDAYLRIYHGAPGYRPDGKPMAWILTITRNLALTVLRKRQGGEVFAFDALERVLSENPAFSAEDAWILRAVLETLDEGERQLVTLHVIGGLKHRETARMLGIPLSTVLSKYARALGKLKRALKEAEEDDKS